MFCVCMSALDMRLVELRSISPKNLVMHLRSSVVQLLGTCPQKCCPKLRGKTWSSKLHSPSRPSEKLGFFRIVQVDIGEGGLSHVQLYVSSKSQPYSAISQIFMTDASNTASRVNLVESMSCSLWCSTLQKALAACIKDGCAFHGR